MSKVLYKSSTLSLCWIKNSFFSPWSGFTFCGQLFLTCMPLAFSKSFLGLQEYSGFSFTTLHNVSCGLLGSNNPDTPDLNRFPWAQKRVNNPFLYMFVKARITHLKFSNSGCKSWNSACLFNYVISICLLLIFSFTAYAFFNFFSQVESLYIGVGFSLRSSLSISFSIRY